MLPLIAPTNIIIKPEDISPNFRMPNTSIPRETFEFESEDFRNESIRLFLGGEGIGVRDATFSPDGKQIATVSSNRDARLWDASDGREILEFHTRDHNKLKYSPSGKLLVSFSYIGSLMRCLITSTGGQRSDFNKNDGLVTDAAFIDDDRVVSVCDEGSGIIWNTSSGEVIAAITGHQGYRIDTVAVSPDAKTIVTTSRDQRSIALWDASDGGAIAYLAWLGEELPNQVVFNPFGTNLVLLSQYGPTQILELSDDGPIGESLMDFNSFSQTDQSNLGSFRVVKTLEDDSAQMAQFSRDGRYLVVLTQGGEVTTFETDEFNRIGLIDQGDSSVNLFDLAPDASCLVTAQGIHPQVISDGETRESQLVTFWEPLTSEPMFALHGHDNLVEKISFDVTGKKLMTASRDGTVAIWTLDIPSATLFSSAATGADKRVSRLLGSGAKSRVFFNMAPFQMAALEGHLESVEIFLNHGISVDSQSVDNGATALFAAAQEGHLEIVKLLIAYGANTDLAILEDKLAPLHIAAIRGHSDVVKELVRSGADINVRTKRMATPLYEALCRDQESVALSLIDLGADINSTSLNNESILYAALYTEFNSIVDKLLELKVDLDTQTNEGYFPLYIAVDKNRYDFTEKLILAGACVNLQTNTGFSCLHSAASLNLLEIVELLLKHGVKTDLKTDEGQTALDVAKSHNNGQVVALLNKYKVNA